MGYGIGNSSNNLATYTPEPIGLGGGGGSLDVEDEEQPDIGKGSIDLTDPVGSIGKTLGNTLALVGQGPAAGLVKALGSLGPDAETASLGQLAEDIGRIPGGVGDFQLPHIDLIEGDQQRQAATLSQIPGAMYDPIFQAQEWVKRTIARGRVEARATPETDPLGALPPDLLRRLDAGESVDAITEELLARGESFSSNKTVQLGGEMIFDPLNLIAPGAGKALQAGREAVYAVRAADDLSKLGLTQRSVGTIFDVAAKGMSRGGGAVMDRVVGPTTSGVFHALGSKPYRSLLSGAAKLSPDYAQKFERAFSLGAGQLPRAVIGREIMEDVKSGLAKVADNVSATVERRLIAKKPRELERRAEELLSRTTPDFYGATPESLFAETAAKYAAITGMSVEDAGRVLGSRVSRQTARTVHLAYYGHAGGELADIKNVLRGADTNIDMDRLTVLSHSTLTDELADEIGKSIPVADAVDRFSVLSNHFLGKQASDSEVLEFVAKLRGSLPEAVKLPKGGKNKLPAALSGWRARNQEFGYELGFAPKDGWKAIVDENGDVIASDPFVHFVSDVDSPQLANPLGRFVDALMRGKTQTVIVQESRQRMTDFVVKAGLPISPNQVRSIHHAILEAAADAKETPRGLIGLHTEGGTVYESIFRKFLTPAEYDTLTAQFDPTYLVMKAFEGNLRTVGLTQKLTGAIKTAAVEGKVPGGANIVRIAEHLYPKARFTYRPTFQAQEIIESPTFNALRGVTDREVAPELVDAYRALAEQPEFRFLTEANFLNIAGDRAAAKFMGKNSPLGRAMGRFTNIQARKETARVRQVMFEHGEDFKTAVNNMNPKFWKAMEEAYGTTDASVIADSFLAERLALSSGDVDEVMRVVDEAARPTAQDVARGMIVDSFDEPVPKAPIRLVNGEWEIPPGTRGARRIVRTEDGTPMTAEMVQPPIGGRDIEVPGTREPLKYVYRAVSEDDWLNIQKTGSMKSDGRMNLLPDEGTVADTGDPSFYLPGSLASDELGDYPGRILRIRVEPEDGWRINKYDSYVKTPNAIPLDRIDEVSPKIISRKHEVPSSVTGNPIAFTDRFVENAGQRIQAAYDAGDVATGQAENIAEGIRNGGSAVSGGAVKVEGALPTSASDQVLQAFKDSMRQASNRAFKTHFFQMERGWLERSLNHPYLGLYPLSYMWGKVLPEFARFLLVRPFGKNVPLLPLVNLERVQQAYVGALADNPDFRKYMEDHEESIYFANLLFPGNPVNLTANAPAYARHIVEDAQAGRKVDSTTVTREIADSTGYAFGPAHDITSLNKAGADLVDIGQDIFAMLEKAAREFDGQFPRP